MSTKKLLIVESSSKCGSIETYLGPNYKCISCNGHIRCINDLKSIDTKNNFETRYKVDPDKKAHLKKMLAVISTFPKQNIILATDHDREGEAIAWHICEVFDLPPETTSRIVFHEVTKAALLKAIESPRTIDMNMVRAQQARQVLDLLVGFSVSPLLWTYVNNNSLSAGRCQTPALRLVYENDLVARDKENKSAQKHKVSACFFPQNLMFDLDKEFETPEDVKKFLSLSTKHEHKFFAHPQKLSERSPPKPFNTSAILQAANNTLHMGAKETMACCQTLYQLGHITYMRTENRKYSPIFIDVASTYISKQWTEKHVNPQLLELHGNNDSTNPHEAIRVTNILMRDIVLIGANDNKHVSKVYKLIWQNTVQSCMAPAIFNTLPLEVDAPDNHKYKHTLELPKFKGFLDAIETKETSTLVTPQLFSSMSMRSQTARTIQYNYIQTTVGFTNKHSRYTEASLISKLEDMGIGRPSTFSMLVDIIQTRKYVNKTDIAGTKQKCLEYMLRSGDKEPTEKTCEKTMGAEHNKLVIDPIGIVAIEFLIKHFECLFSYNYTKDMEERLDQVATGQELWYKVCEDCYRDMKQQIKSITKGEKKVYALADNDNYVLVFCKATSSNKNSFVMKEKNTGLYKTVKRDFKFDMEKLEAGAYKYEELAEIEDRILGTWNKYEIKLKVGKYGPYLEYGDQIHVSLKQPLDKSLDKIELEDVVSHLEKESLLRVLTPELSIRKSKYGAYIFYKTEKMKKPKFFDLKKFDFETCETQEVVEWITKTYLS
jgi:DNA topoisomerase-1